LTECDHVLDETQMLILLVQQLIKKHHS